MATEQTLAVELKGIEPVAESERHGKPGSVFSLWWGANVEFATLTIGALATSVFGLSFGTSLITIIIGNVLGALMLGALSIFGPRLGVAQMVHSRKPFGYYGNFIPGVLNFFAGFSWFAVNTVLGVYAIEWLLGWSFLLSLIVIVVIQVVVAIIGYNLIHAMERWMSILLTIIFLIVTIYAIPHTHLGGGFNPKASGAGGGQLGSFILELSVVFSYVLGWMAFSSDYTRYLPSKTPAKKVFGNAFWSILISCFWLEGLGAALGTLTFVSVPNNLVTNLLPYGLGVLAMLAVIVGTVTANVLNIYSGALSSLVLDIPMKRWVAAIVVGVIGTVISYIGGQHNYWEHYQQFLFLLGYWVAPWVAVVGADYFIKQKGRYDTSMFYDRKRAFGPGAIAWIVGVLVSIPFMNQYPLFVGFFANAHPSIGDIAYFVGFVVSFVVYMLIAKPHPAGAEERASS